MSALTAAKCESCDRVEPYTFGTHPEDWWIVFGPRGTARLDFCSIACLSTYTRPHVPRAALQGDNTP